MIIGIVIAVIQSSEVGKAQKRTTEIEAELNVQKRMVDDQKTRYRAFSAVAGFTGGTEDGSPENATKLFESAKKELAAETPANAKTIEDVLNAALAIINRQKRDVAEREQQIGGLKSEVTAQTASVATARGDLQKLIDDANTRSKDQQSTDAAKISNLEQQLSDKEKAAKDAAEKVTAIQEQKDKDSAEWTKKSNLLEAKNADLNSKIAFTRKPAQPKGNIIATSDLLPIGYINLGDKQRVSVGMRFQVMNYDSNHKLVDKGMVEVTKLEPSMSEVRIETKEKLNPIGKGDVLLNPLYDPTAQRKAVLVGRFPLSTGGRKGVEEKLKALGVSVADKVDPTVDFLIVGNADLSNTGDAMDMESIPR